MLLLPLSCYNYFTLRQQSADYACSTIPHGLTGSNKPLLTLLANPSWSSAPMIVGSALLAKQGNGAP